MRRITILLFLFASVNCFSQNMAFDHDGKLTGTKGFKNDVNTPALTFKLTLEQKIEIKKALAVKFSNALDNLQDDKYNLHGIYDNIWMPGVTEKIIADYKGFLAYLQDNFNPAANHDIDVTNGFILKPSEFDAQVFDASIYTEKDDKTGKEYNMRQLIFTDPYKYFIVNYLQTTMSINGIERQLMDINYKKAWRDLEETYNETEKALADIREALKPCIPTSTNDTKYLALAARLKALLQNKSNLVQKILQKDFFKKWLWYNEGFLFMNPTSATTKERQYPIGEKISKLGDSAKNILLSDSIQAKILTDILTTKKLKNEVLISKTTTVDRYFYDAAQNYLCLNTNDLPKSRDNRKGIGVVVYNVSVKEKLAFDWSKSKDIPDAGSISQSIIEAGNPFPNIADWVTAWGKVSQTFNGTSPSPVYNSLSSTLTSTIISTPINKGKVAFGWTAKKDSYITQTPESMKKKSDSGLIAKISASTILLEKFKIPSEEKETKLFVKIHNRFVIATKNSEVDKIIFIKAYLIKDDVKECNTCNDYIENCIIDSFIISDRCYSLNYEDQSKLDKGTSLLLERFKCYIKNIDKFRSQLKSVYDDINNNYLPGIKAYVSIIQRSLPPVFTKQTNGYKEEMLSKDTAEYRTEVFETPKDDLPDSAKKLVFSIVSSLPGKKVDGKNTTPNIVIQHSYRYSKRHWIDFSAGLAWSITDYNVKNVDAGLPKVAEGDRFRPIAGMHIYPLGLLKIDDSAWPLQKSRLSIFLGLGITKALENFYPGISYDVVPGIRILSGYHIYKDTKYTIINNSVIDQASSYKASGLFFSLNMEPKAFASFIGLIK